MHINHIWSKASKPAQLLAMLVTTALVMIGVTTLPAYAAAPTLKLAITPDTTSYLSGVEQRYVVELDVYKRQALHAGGAWCVVLARSISAARSVQNSPCSASWW